MPGLSAMLLAYTKGDRGSEAASLIDGPLTIKHESTNRYPRLYQSPAEVAPRTKITVWFGSIGNCRDRQYSRPRHYYLLDGGMDCRVCEDSRPSLSKAARSCFFIFAN